MVSQGGSGGSCRRNSSRLLSLGATSGRHYQMGIDHCAAGTYVTATTTSSDDSPHSRGRYTLPMQRATMAILIIATFGCSSTSRTDPIDELMRSYTGDVPGASVLVVKDGRSVVSRSYGLADLETRAPATPATNYRLASITKQFTATAVMLLEERGLVEYDDPISRYFPSLPPATRNVTVRHLLTHTSGLVDYEDLIPESQTEQVYDRDVLRLLESEDRLLFAAGSSYRYSNSAYALLALLVEKLSGQSFATFLEKNVFAPLGMRNTVAYENGVSTVPHRAYGHSLIDGRFQRTDQSVTSAVLGDGGIYSSANDLAAWEHALSTGRAASTDSLARAWTPATKTDQPNVEYGFGWRISEHKGTRMLWHSGETRGFRNVMMRFPEKKLTVAVLTNRNDPEPYPTALRIAELYLAGR